MLELQLTFQAIKNLLLNYTRKVLQSWRKVLPSIVETEKEMFGKEHSGYTKK